MVALQIKSVYYTKQLYLFTSLGLSYLIHKDLFYNLFGSFMFLNAWTVSGWTETSGFNKIILICVLKIKQNCMGLEWHEGEIMTELSFLDELLF